MALGAAVLHHRERRHSLTRPLLGPCHPAHRPRVRDHRLRPDLVPWILSSSVCRYGHQLTYSHGTDDGDVGVELDGQREHGSTGNQRNERLLRG